MPTPQPPFAPTDLFVERHLGPRAAEMEEMLGLLDVRSLDELMAETLPEVIRSKRPLELSPPKGEHELTRELLQLARQNSVAKSYLGMGYYDCIVPAVIQRNIMENPGWYTQYTPYQAEISQGRLEALLNFQTMISELCALPVANASLLDEATAAAEAMNMCRAVVSGRNTFFVAADCHPQTIAVVQTRAEALGVQVVVGDAAAADFADLAVFGVLIQYPGTSGEVRDPRPLVDKAHAAGALAVLATDLLALTLLVPPGELGADIAVGSAQRFGVPLGYGGPHPAFLATQEKHKRLVPGRIVGVSRDARGRPALRLAMQTREQHIRRERATSNICTAQVLLAIMASMYAVYHGPRGLCRIAERVHGLAATLALGLGRLGLQLQGESYFDTLCVKLPPQRAAAVVQAAQKQLVNLRCLGDDAVVIALDETTTLADVQQLLSFFGADAAAVPEAEAVTAASAFGPLARTSSYLMHPVFNQHHSETEMLRYMRRLEVRDLALNTAMIPLGSCTMKLNGTSEMLALSWPEIAQLHPFAPLSQARGYQQLFADLEAMLAEVTGFSAVSLQPNAGSQGEYAGLLVIRRYHAAHGAQERKVCLIPQSAHGTNPASATLAGMQVVVVACDKEGNIDLADLEAKAAKHEKTLAALMVTYPSTHGVFEEGIRKVCDIVHRHGGQVYMDGANLNAQVGLARPGEIGADVCHLNLHKTFAIPHGGGGPGMGPIAVAEHLAPYLPSHPVVPTGGSEAIGAVAAAPWGSPSILTISWMYMKLMGATGLRRATEVAILNANYMAKRLEGHYPIVYRGRSGRVAHEFILDLRPFKESAGIEVEDVAKRLIDYGFHAPTMSWPVAGTLMIEPTESEPKSELDRFCEAMISIRQEIQAIVDGTLDRKDNPLKNAPHTAEMVSASEWTHPYGRELGAYPSKYVRQHKYWPPVARVDNAWGDRNFVCTCPPLESYT